VIRDCEELTRLARFGDRQLPADWVRITGAKAVAPAPDKPPRFGYDAIRMPLYAAIGNRADLAAPVKAWWRGCLAQHRPIPAWVDVISGAQAPYALSSGGAAVVARLLGTSPPAVLDTDYFSASLQLLAQL
jgi:endoglucanase